MNLETDVVINETDKNKVVKDVDNEKKSIVIAPGEGKLPSNFLDTPNFDVKAYPRHHPSGRYGIHHERTQKLTFQKYAMQRIQNKDTRFCTDMSYIFMMQQLVERNLIQGQLSLAGRKGTMQNSSDNYSKKIHLNDPFNVLAKICGSPKYWQIKRSELIAKVKQLGPFHLFLTFSCAEMRWFDVFIAVLESKGFEVEFDCDKKEEWDGDESKIWVKPSTEDGEKKPLWKFIDDMNESKHEVLKDCVYLVTMHFEERVKSLFKNIIMQRGKDYDGEEKVPIEHFNYRIEFQARGMPHVHAVAWIEKEYLQKHGITGDLIDHPEEAITLADRLIHTKLPTDDLEFRSTVMKVQKHNHTNSCRKKTGSCRYNIPRPPLKKTILAKSFYDMTRDERVRILGEHKEEDFEKLKEQFLEKSKKVMMLVKDFLEAEVKEKDKKRDLSKATWEDFFKFIAVSEEDYMKIMSVTQRGRQIIYKRDIDAVFINNFNEEMLRAWDGNMDIQLASDPYAVVAYVVGYVSKDETGMTKELTNALKAAKMYPNNEKLKLLATTYLTHRQIGGPEAIYRLISGMKLANSNIACIFVTTGFPENRSVFYIPVKEGEGQQNEENEESEDPWLEHEDDDNFTDLPKKAAKGIQIEGKAGTYRPSIGIIDKYAERPNYLEEMSLAQFAICYVSQGRIRKSITFREEIEQQGTISDQQSVTQTVYAVEEHIPLPECIKLKNDLGYMRLRTKPIVLRYHLSKKKEGHEEPYSEMLLFHPWRNEVEEFHRYEAEKCIAEYAKKTERINAIKGSIFPGEKAIELYNFDLIEENRPQHIYDALNCQGEQANEDDNEEEVEDHPDIAPMPWNGPNANDGNHGESSRNSAKFKQIERMAHKDLLELTLKLAPEQKEVLTKFITYCKDVVKGRAQLDMDINQLLLLIHGRAGKFISVE